MKKTIAMLLTFVFIITIPVNTATLYASMNNNYIANKLSIMPQDETMFTDIGIPGGKVIVSNWEKGIKYVQTAPELVLITKDRIPSGYTIDLKLTNLYWFFRSVELKNNSHEYYNNGIEKRFPTSFDTLKGTYESDMSKNRGGTYTRLSIDDEISYQLEINEDGRNAKLEFLEDAEYGDYIHIPLITRLAYNTDASIEVISENLVIESGVYPLLANSSSGSSNLAPRTAVTVSETVSSDEIFELGNIIITENMEGSIKNGSFVISSSQGCKIVPNADDLKLTDINGKTLSMAIDDAPIIKVTLSGGVKWAANKEGRTEGILGSDYELSYRNPAGVINNSQIIVKLKNISPSTNNTGTLTISGLKLIADNDAENGDVTLNIERYEGIDALSEQSVVIGQKVAKGTLISKNLSDYNIETLTLEELIESPGFKAKRYVYPFAEKAGPVNITTRAELCNMLYLLLADTAKIYEHPFSDVNGEYENAIAFCYSKGYVSGYEDGLFNPDSYLRRGELAVILNNILKYNEDVSFDRMDKEHWSYNAMAQLVNKGIIFTEESNALVPESLVKRYEAVVLINRAFKRGAYYNDEGVTFSDLKASEWYYGYMMNAINGYTTSK